MKRCADTKHEGPAGLPSTDFYAGRGSGGRLAYCKTCQKRRATADQSKRRAARREKGLPSSEEAYKKLAFNQRVRPSLPIEEADNNV